MTTHREAAQTVFAQLAAPEDGNPHYRQIDIDTLVLIFETVTKAARKAVLDEREACAVIAETRSPDDDRLDFQVRQTVANAIRSRK